MYSLIYTLKSHFCIILVYFIRKIPQLNYLKYFAERHALRSFHPPCIGRWLAMPIPSPWPSTEPLATSSSGHFELWPLQPLDTSSPGHFNLWPLRALATSTSGLFVLWPLWIHPVWASWPLLANSTSGQYELKDPMNSWTWWTLAQTSSGQYESVARTNVPRCPSPSPHRGGHRGGHCELPALPASPAARYVIRRRFGCAACLFSWPVSGPQFSEVWTCTGTLGKFPRFFRWVFRTLRILHKMCKMVSHP